MKKRRLRQRTIAWVGTLVVSFIVLMPVYWILISSLTERNRLFQSPIDYFPDVTFKNYLELFMTTDMKGMLGGTLLITIVSGIVTLACGFLASYAIVRIRFVGAAAVMGFFLLSQLLPTSTTIIPLYDFMKKLNLVDTYPGIILLYISNLLPFTILVLVSFISQIPVQIEEAARVDGAGRIQTMLRVTLPLLRPAVATVCIINFINCVNEFFLPMIFSIQKIKTLSVGITVIPRLNQYNVPWEKISAMGVIMVLPILLFVVFFQENIMEGLTNGGVKE